MKFKEITEIQNLNFKDRFYFIGDAKKTVWENMGQIDGSADKIQVASVYGGKVKPIHNTMKVVFLRSKDDN